MLTDYPVQFASPAVRQALRTLDAVYKVDDIIAIALDAGLPIGQIAIRPESSLTWRSVFEVAAGHGRVRELFNEVAARRPTLRPALEELLAAQPVLDAEAPLPADPGWKNFSADGRAEAVIVAGQPTFVDVAFLSLGVLRARSVCRMVTRFPAGAGSGTGFRVGASHLLTNYHVLFDAMRGDEPVTAVQAWFDYEDDVDGTAKPIVQIRCDPASILGEKVDDWAVVRTTEPIPAQFPVLLLDGAPVPAVDDRVAIVQHPGGRPKQVALQHNLVRAVLPDVLQYWTDTDLGSSGSPVFDQQWNVVALHHFSVPAPAEDRINVRNQGRRIDRIAERIRSVAPGVIA
jgi:V8-like Glu-specific endopeptidase